MTAWDQLRKLHDETATALAGEGKLTVGLLERMERKLTSALHRLRDEPRRDRRVRRQFGDRCLYRGPQ